MGIVSFSSSPLESLLLEFIMDAREPAWIMVKEIPEMGGSRDRVEALLWGLEARGLVDHTREAAVEPGGSDPIEPTEWWGLTEAGWGLLGEEPSPSYG